MTTKNYNYDNHIEITSKLSVHLINATISVLTRNVGLVYTKKSFNEGKSRMQLIGWKISNLLPTTELHISKSTVLYSGCTHKNEKWPMYLSISIYIYFVLEWDFKYYTYQYCKSNNVLLRHCSLNMYSCVPVILTWKFSVWNCNLF
jgi:hypothetical protein